jgi:hypothetical protein
MVSMASRESLQAASCAWLVHSTAVGLGVGVGVGVDVGVPLAVGMGEGVVAGDLEGVGDGLRLRADDGRAPSRTAVTDPVPMRTTSTITDALGLESTTAQRVA